MSKHFEDNMPSTMVTGFKTGELQMMTGKGKSMTDLCTATLIDWKIDNYYGQHRLIGTIAGEDVKGRFESGDVIVTSRLKHINFDTMKAVTASGSIYKLEI